MQQQPVNPDEHGQPINGESARQTQTKGGKEIRKYQFLFLGGLFYGGLLAFCIWYLFFKVEPPQFFLGMDPGKSQINVAVFHKGAPVKDGKVQIRVINRVTDEILGSHVLTIVKNEDPSKMLLTPFEEVWKDKKLEITAYFQGNNKDDEPVSGVSSLSLNAQQVYGKSIWRAYGPVGLVLVIFVWQLIVFTGRMTHGKLRSMIMFMYFMTFLSISIPAIISYALYAWPESLEVMVEAPIGILRGTIAEDKNTEKIQWLLNIGGIPKLFEEEKVPPSLPNDKKVTIIGEFPSEKHKLDYWIVQGGVVVPFYMVVLAMLGAGINLTRRVPEIQQRYTIQTEGNEVGNQAEHAFMSKIMPFLSTWWETIPKEAAEEVAKTRSLFISQYMYLLSAPFLAIAVYYLLQVFGKDVETPVLVVMSLATGLVSDRIVLAITGTAKRFFSAQEEGEGKDEKKGPDQPPKVFIEGPVITGETHTTEESKVSLRGIATDDRKVTEVKWKNEKNNTHGFASLHDGETRRAWQIPEIELVLGLNEISVVAKDLSGNESEPAKITVKYEPVA